MRFGITTLVSALALAVCCIAVSQAQQATVELPRFDAVSIRPADPGGMARWRFVPDGVSFENIALPALIMEAYGVRQPYQLLGMPKWAESAHYAIQAKVDEADVPALEKLKHKQMDMMVQPILVERFSLRCHWETRALPVEKLQVSGKSANLKDAAAADNSKTVTVGDATIGAGSLLITATGHIMARAINMQTLVSYLEGQVNKDVIDETGLTGKYDFEMQLPSSYTNPSGAAEDGSQFQDSRDDLIQDGLSQIGLKLASSKAEVPVLVIDELKPPTAN